MKHMRFLCLCYYDQAKFDALPESEQEAIGRACQPHDEALRGSGRLILVGSLALPQASRSLRPGDGRPRVTDGPFVDTKEPLGAFFMIEAKDMDEALQVASLHPGAHLGAYFGGGIEVRPIDMLDQPDAKAGGSRPSH
jgi:hypothetical protein